MWRLMLAAIVTLGCIPAVAQAGWFSDELPPATAKPLSQIIKIAEDKGLKQITDVEFDDGVWNIEAHQADGKEVHLKIDPISGETQE